jgi:gluconolactonase
MNKLTILFLFIGMNVYAQKEASLIARGATVQLISDGFAFTEGPAVDKDGNVYFTDQPNDRIWKWSAEDNKVSLFKEKEGRANGLYIDRQGFLYSCADMENELWKYGKDGGHTILVTDFEGKKLNGPNDLWVAPNGGIYFSDAYYKRDYWTRTPGIQTKGENVYYLTPDYKQLIQVTSDIEKPNGIVGTPDGKRLYVADIKANKTYIFNIQSDGTLTNKKLFCESGSDGMTLDNKGNVYLSGRGVTVFNPKGEKIAQIPVAAGWTGNVCFGGKDRKTLVITASEFLYTLKMKVKGVE